MADGADAALFVSDDTYKAAMFACIFAEPVHGFVWCDRHGWVLADEACVCGDCVHEAMEADFERLCEIEERAWLQTERAAEWAVQQHVSQLPRADPPCPRETVEQQVRGAIFDMAKGKDVSRIFR
jgi:hypothetical protein